VAALFQNNSECKNELECKGSNLNKALTDTGIQKNLDFGCGFGFLNPKSKLNQNIQKTKKPHPKPNHKIKKTKNQIQNQSRFLVF
jgi:hypothetical protein